MLKAAFATRGNTTARGAVKGHSRRSRKHTAIKLPISGVTSESTQMIPEVNAATVGHTLIT